MDSSTSLHRASALLVDLTDLHLPPFPFPSIRYVHVTYIPCHSKAELCAKMKQLSEAPEGEAPPFLEATVYSKETSVIMVGEFDDADTSEKRRKINGVNYFWCVRSRRVDGWMVDGWMDWCQVVR
jgi:hypothetical protein